MTTLSIHINGAQHDVEVEPRTLLVDLLRRDLGLTGTHVGCDPSQCGTPKPISAKPAIMQPSTRVLTISTRR